MHKIVEFSMYTPKTILHGLILWRNVFPLKITSTTGMEGVVYLGK